MEIGTGIPVQAQIEVMKKATDIQEQTVSTLLDNSAQQLKQQQNTVEQTQKTSGASLTGLGTGLDITA